MLSLSLSLSYLSLSLAHYPFQESSVSVSRNFHNLCGRACGPDRFIPVPPLHNVPEAGPLLFFFSSFFHGALKALESEGAERGKMTVNHDALSPGGLHEALSYSSENTQRLQACK